MEFQSFKKVILNNSSLFSKFIEHICARDALVLQHFGIAEFTNEVIAKIIRRDITRSINIDPSRFNKLYFTGLFLIEIIYGNTFNKVDVVFHGTLPYEDIMKIGYKFPVHDCHQKQMLNLVLLSLRDKYEEDRDTDLYMNKTILRLHHVSSDPLEYLSKKAMLVLMNSFCNDQLLLNEDTLHSILHHPSKMRRSTLVNPGINLKEEYDIQRAYHLKDFKEVIQCGYIIHPSPFAADLQRV
jgi:hypothetical protein